MDYRIVRNPKYTNSVKVGVVTSPDNEPLKFILSGVSLKNLVNFLSCVHNSEAYTQENIIVSPFSSMDWESKAEASKVKGSEVEEGDISLWHCVFGESIVEENLFRDIVKDYTEMIIRVYRDERSLGEKWINDVSECLDNLKSK